LVLSEALEAIGMLPPPSLSPPTLTIAEREVPQHIRLYVPGSMREAMLLAYHDHDHLLLLLKALEANGLLPPPSLSLAPLSVLFETFEANGLLPPPLLSRAPPPVLSEALEAIGMLPPPSLSRAPPTLTIADREGLHHMRLYVPGSMREAMLLAYHDHDYLPLLPEALEVNGLLPPPSLSLAPLSVLSETFEANGLPPPPSLSRAPPPVLFEALEANGLRPPLSASLAPLSVLSAALKANRLLTPLHVPTSRPLIEPASK
jgi:hypothetical protein